MHIVTLNTKGEAGSFLADEAQAKLFENEPDRFPDDLSGWVIGNESDLTSQLSKNQMVAVYNSLTGGTLKKFSNKDAGAVRTMPEIERKARPFEELTSAPTTEAPKTRRGRSDRGDHNIPAKERAVACRPGTKQQLLIEALAKGSTMAELLEAMSSKNGGKSWKEASITSGFHEDVNTKKGYGVRTEIVTEGDPSSYIYHLVYPEGVTEVLATSRTNQVTDS